MADFAFTEEVAVGYSVKAAATCIVLDWVSDENAFEFYGQRSGRRRRDDAQHLHDVL